MHFLRTFRPVPESDLTADERRSHSTGADVCNYTIKKKTQTYWVTVTTLHQPVLDSQLKGSGFKSQCAPTPSCSLITLSLWIRAYSGSPKRRCLLTFCDGSCSAGLGEAVALSHWTAETHVHEALSDRGQGGAARQHHPHAPAEQSAHLLEQQPAKTDGFSALGAMNMLEQLCSHQVDFMCVCPCVQWK